MRTIALRAAVMLATVVPVFAASVFRPLWWHVLLAALLGSAIGRGAVLVTRDRRTAAWAIIAAAAIVALSSGVWVVTSEHGAREPANGTLIVRARGNATLTWDDVQAITHEVPSIRVAATMRTVAQITSGDATWQTGLVGVTPEIFDVEHLRIAAGEAFRADKVNAVVIGQTVADQLFGTGQSPVGEVVRIKNMPFTIAGILARKGHSPDGQDEDDVALVPLATYRSRIDGTSSFHHGVLIIAASSSDQLPHVESELRTLLRDRHRLGPGDEDDFTVLEH
ncbi:MAG: hypothetical protein JWO36_6980 [Myxococcales bacterium]|nr:hypothetical protein [Myxococcales bacterium]